MKRVAFVLLALSLCATAVGIGATARPAAAQGPYKIGAVLDVSGPVSFLGQVEKNGIEQAIDEVNRAGGVNGRKLELVLYDDEGNNTRTVTAVKRLIEQDNVLAILGPTGSGNTLSAIPLVEKAGVSLISFALSVKIVDPIKKYTFQYLPNDVHGVERTVQDMKARGLTKVAMTYVANAYGESGRDQLRAFAPKAGITIMEELSYGEKDTDLTPVVTRVASSGAQAVMNWSVSPSSVVFLKNMQQQGLKIPIYHSSVWASQRFLDLSGTAANVVRIATNKIVVADQLADSDPNKAPIVEFSRTYTERFKLPPPPSAAEARDAVYAVAMALKKSGPDRAKLRDELEKINNFVATAGTYNFSPTDHNGIGTKDLVIVGVEGGKFVLLK
jgi:branched-chain amino acid transport system substrate-binding protein